MGKHNGSYGKQYGKVVGKDADERPGYKGPSQTKKAQPPKKDKAKKESSKIEEEKEEEVSSELPVLPIELQQLLLGIYRDAFPEVITSESLQTLLQDVKSALYERDFERAFGKEEFLEAYSIRWSPTRALCYASILTELKDHFDQDLGLDRSGEAGSASQSTMKSVCFGGGAAEVVAFGGFLRLLRGASKSPSELADAMDGLSVKERQPDMDILLVDSAQWGVVVAKLHDGLSLLPTLPKYANAATRAANCVLLAPSSINTTFQLEDALSLSQERVSDIVQGRALLTLLFTLNELYTASMAKTTTFLLNLTLAATSGTLLLVVDSPGSYSEVKIGSEAKKYPMQMLLDHTLLGSRKAEESGNQASWTKLISNDAKWFRLSTKIQYPLPLENMRYQLHLYRRN